MSRLLRKLSFKYEFLQLELEETEENADEYLTEFNKYFGKYFIDQQAEKWINEETGEIRDKPPGEEEHKKREAKHPKLKKLYKKLSTYMHPDKGGTDDDFARLRNAYDKNDLFGLMQLATENEVNVELEENDVELAEKSILRIQNSIQNHRNTLSWNYVTGDKKKKLQVIKMLEMQLKIKIDPKDYPKEIL